MIPASTYLPSTTSSTIAASSIKGIGVNSFSNATRAGFDAVSHIELGPNRSALRRASSLVRPSADSLPDDPEAKASTAMAGGLEIVMTPPVHLNQIVNGRWFADERLASASADLMAAAQ